MLSLWSSFSQNPWVELGRTLSSFERLRREMDRLFEEYGQSFGAATEAVLGPPADLADNGTAYVIRADVPGLTEKDLEITIDGNAVTLRGERKDDVPEGYSVHRKERGAVKFARSWRLPARVEPDQAEAKLKDGVLVLTIPKAKEAQAKQIVVKTG